MGIVIFRVRLKVENARALLGLRQRRGSATPLEYEQAAPDLFFCPFSVSGEIPARAELRPP